MLTPEHQLFVKLLDEDIKRMGYGTITVNIIVKDGVPIPNSLSVSMMRRKKYKLPTASNPIDKLPHTGV